MSYSDTTPTTFIKCALAWVLFAVCLPGGIAVRGASAQTDPALRPGQPEARLEALVRSMTLEEKLGQLTQFSAGQSVDQGPDVQKQKRDELHALIREGKVGSLLNAHGVQYINGLQRVAVEESRLHVPLLFANDVIHGYRTIFPIPLAEASSWDPGLVERAARVAAVEASAAGTHWTFAPMVDIARDPRWGRVAEGSGEDPYLGSLMAAARVRGFQGSDLAAADTILACAKHFAAYGAAEGGRDYNTVDISEQTLREVFLPPFRATVEAGAGSFMSGFNELNGVPATAHPLLLRRVLRGEWQFDGVVISDWTSITEMIAHGFVRDPAEAAQRALAAGVDVDMCSFAYLNHLGAALGRGAISPSAVDHGVRRVLRAKLSLNLFDRPYGDPKREKEVVLSSQNRAVARRVAARSIVLLKNEKALLPLSPEVRRLAVIGPLSDDRKAPLGTWAPIGRAEDVVTVLEGLRSRVSPDTKITHVPGCGVSDPSTTGFAEAVRIASESDVAVLVIGEDAEMSGEAHCRSTIDLPGVQRQLVEAIQATGTPVVAVVLAGRPLSITWTAEHVPAILFAWHLGVESGNAIADVLFGDHNPSARLPMTFPRTVGQIPLYYNHKPTGRPPTDQRYTSKYIDVPWTPLYPFGYGLSYTTFRYDKLTVSAGQIGVAGTVTVSVEVTNVGQRDGDEVVQLYVRDVVGSMTRPVRQLKAFKRITLQPGQTETVVFSLAAGELGFYDYRVQYTVEPGEFEVWVGPNSAEGQRGRFELVSD